MIVIYVFHDIIGISNAVGFFTGVCLTTNAPISSECFSFMLDVGNYTWEYKKTVFQTYITDARWMCT